MENVAVLASARHAVYLSAKIEELQNLGYDVAVKILDTSEFGVPQYRRRVIVLGGLRGAPVHPEPVHGKRVSARRALRTVPKDIPNRAITTYARQPVLRPDRKSVV